MLSKKHREILLASADLFQKQGYAATSMRQLAKAVNIEPSSLYSHIKSKEAILQMICAEQSDKFIQFMQWIMEQDDDPIDKIKALLMHQMQIAYDDSTAITVFNDEWKHLNETHLTSFLKARKAYEADFITIIEEGIKDGKLKKVSSKIILNTMLSSVKWIHFQSNRNIANPDNFEEIVDIILGGILAV